MIIFHPNLSRLAMQPSFRSPLSDDTKKSGKKSRGRTCYAPPCSTLFNFFRVEPNVLESQKFFYEIIFDPSESDEPIFEKFGGLFFLRCSFWLKSPIQVFHIKIRTLRWRLSMAYWNGGFSGWKSNSSDTINEEGCFNRIVACSDKTSSIRWYRIWWDHKSFAKRLWLFFLSSYV